MHRIVAPIVIAVGATVMSLPATAQADLNKVLHASFPIAETSFDPQAVNDIYSNYVIRAMFDTLYIYDYLARPYKLVPNTAVALPEISADGRTWTLKVKPGIYFSADPAFKGQKRELTAADMVRNARTGTVRVDPRSYAVTLDGEPVSARSSRRGTRWRSD